MVLPVTIARMMLRSSVVDSWLPASSALGTHQCCAGSRGLAASAQQRHWLPPMQAAVQHLTAVTHAAAAAATRSCHAQTSHWMSAHQQPAWSLAARLGSSRHLSTLSQGSEQQPRQSSSPACEASAQQQPSVSIAYDATQDNYRRKRPVDMDERERLAFLREKALNELAWDPGELVLRGGAPEHTTRGVCFECGNGSRGEDCFAVTVKADESGMAELLTWYCHRATCGNSGVLSVHTDSWRVEGALHKSAAAMGQALPFGLPSLQQQQGLQQPGQQQLQQQLNLLPGQANSTLPGGSMPPTQQQQQQPAMRPPAPPPPPPPSPQQLGARLQPLTPDLLAWFEARGISAATLQRNCVQMERRWCGALREQADHIAFPYYRDGALVNIKYRALPKHFSQVKGGQQVFYGYDDARGADEVVIVEGEMDKLAIEEAFLRTQQQPDTPQPAAADSQQPLQQPLQSSSASTPHFASKRGGRLAVVSVPAGAPARALGPATGERKFKFLDDCSDILTAAKRVVLAVDSDQPGLVLANELARRVGREKCLVATWPSSRAPAAAAAAAPASATPTAAAEAAAAQADSPAAAAAADDDGSSSSSDTRSESGGDWARKDANEVLVKDGPQALRQCIDDAAALPVKGLYQFNDYWKEVLDLYQQGPAGLSGGVSTGWACVDAYYKVVPGELTIVTGLPNSGKSEWLDALVVNLADHEDWPIGICSLENTPKEHGRKLMEKYTRKAFFDAEYAVGISKMSYRDVLDALTWLDDHFHLIRPPQHSMPTIEYILDKARAAVLRYGIRGLIIDPYNELDPRRGSMFETEYVSRTLTKIKRFAQHYDCHVWFVAHPRSQRGLGLGGGMSALSAPSMYDISGSAHFINKADNGIVIHRPYAGALAEAEGKNTRQTQLLVRKVRNKLAGRIGDVALSYDTATGRYSDMPES